MTEPIRRSDVANMVRDWKVGFQIPFSQNRKSYDGTIRVSNNGDDLAPGDAVKITGLGLYQLEAEEAYNDFLTSGVLLAGEKTTSNSDGENYVIAVAAEGIPAGDIGRCYLPGAFGALLGTDDPDTEKYSFVKPSGNGLVMADDGPFEYVAGNGNFAVLIPHTMQNQENTIFAKLCADDMPAERIEPNRWRYPFKQVVMGEDGNWEEAEDGLSGYAYNAFEAYNNGVLKEGSGDDVSKLQNQQANQEDSYTVEEQETINDDVLEPIGNGIVQLFYDYLDEDQTPNGEDIIYYFYAPNNRAVLTFWAKITGSEEVSSDNSGSGSSSKKSNKYKYSFTEMRRSGSDWVQGEISGDCYNGLEGGLEDSDVEYEPVQTGAIVRVTQIPGDNFDTPGDFWFQARLYASAIKVGDAGCDSSGTIDTSSVTFADDKVSQIAFFPQSTTVVKEVDDVKTAFVQFDKMGVISVAENKDSGEGSDVSKLVGFDDFLTITAEKSSSEQTQCITSDYGVLKWAGLYVSGTGTESAKGGSSSAIYCKYMYFDGESFSYETGKTGEGDGNDTIELKTLLTRGDAIKDPYLCKTVIQELAAANNGDDSASAGQKGNSDIAVLQPVKTVLTSLDDLQYGDVITGVEPRKKALCLQLNGSKAEDENGGVALIEKVTYTGPSFKIQYTPIAGDIEPAEEVVTDVQFTPPEYELKSSGGTRPIHPSEDPELKGLSESDPRWQARLAEIEKWYEEQSRIVQNGVSCVDEVELEAAEYEMESETVDEDGNPVSMEQGATVSPNVLLMDDVDVDDAIVAVWTGNDETADGADEVVTDIEFPISNVSFDSAGSTASIVGTLSDTSSTGSIPIVTDIEWDGCSLIYTKKYLSFRLSGTAPCLPQNGENGTAIKKKLNGKVSDNLLSKSKKKIRIAKTKEESLTTTKKSLALEKTQEGSVSAEKAGLSVKETQAGSIETTPAEVSILSGEYKPAYQQETAAEAQQEYIPGYAIYVDDLDFNTEQAITDLGQIGKANVIRDQVHINSYKANCAAIRNGDTGYDEIGQKSDNNQ